MSGTTTTIRLTHDLITGLNVPQQQSGNRNSFETTETYQKPIIQTQSPLLQLSDNAICGVTVASQGLIKKGSAYKKGGILG